MASRDISDFPYFLIGAFVAFEEEIMVAADRLVDKGKSLTPEGRKKTASAKKGLVSRGDDLSVMVARTVQRVLENAGIATEDDLEGLRLRVDALETKVAGPAKKPAAKKKAAQKKKAAKKPAKKPAAKP